MLGLIVGESSLPRFVINKLIKKNLEFLILDLTKSNIYKKYENCYSLKITELGKDENQFVQISINWIFNFKQNFITVALFIIAM